MKGDTVLPRYLRLTDLLDEFDGHDIVGWSWLTEHLAPLGITVDGSTITFGLSKVETGARTAAQMREEFRADPAKGPQLDPDTPDDLMLIGGFEIARALHRLLLPHGAPPSDQFQGRGAGFRADVANLRDNGF